MNHESWNKENGFISFYCSVGSGVNKTQTLNVRRKRKPKRSLCYEGFHLDRERVREIWEHSFKKKRDMRTRRGLCYPRVVEDKNMRVVKRRRDFAAEQVSHRKRSRNSSDIAGKRDLFDSLPDDLVISILYKVSLSDFANVLLTYVLLFFLMKNKFRPFHRSFSRNCGLNFISDMWKTLKTIFFFFFNVVKYLILMGCFWILNLM